MKHKVFSLSHGGECVGGNQRDLARERREKLERDKNRGTKLPDGMTLAKKKEE